MGVLWFVLCLFPNDLDSDETPHMAPYLYTARLNVCYSFLTSFISMHIFNSIPFKYSVLRNCAILINGVHYITIMTFIMYPLICCFVSSKTIWIQIRPLTLRLICIQTVWMHVFHFGQILLSIHIFNSIKILGLKYLCSFIK